MGGVVSEFVQAPVEMDQGGVSVLPGFGASEKLLTHLKHGAATELDSEARKQVMFLGCEKQMW